ncbi:hypothetical protein ACM66B_003730 [Microbotryomycetes sp. NB124-2]
MSTALDSDTLDDLLVEYLTALDIYQQAQQQLALALKDGHFQLAKAKLSLGPTRVGASSYDLSETLPLWTVSIDETDAPGKADGNILSSQPVTRLSINDDPLLAASSAKPEAEPMIRRRAKREEVDGSSDSEPQKASHDHERPKQPRSPMAQFSAFPPPALRQAERFFTRAAKDAVALVSAKVQVEAIERSIGKEKKRLRKLAKAEQS